MTNMNTSFSDNKNEILIHDTPWDARVLGLKSCDVKLLYAGELHSFEALFDQVNEFLSTQGYQFIQIRIDSNDKPIRKLLELAGYYIAEMSYSLTYVNPRKLDLSALNRIDVELVPLTEYDTETVSAIKSIAHHDFHHGRIIEDINVEEGLARQRSANWIDDLLKEPFTLYKAIFRGKLIGFHAEKLERDMKTVNWILTGVSSKYSVYALPLWCAAFKLAQQHEVDLISTMISASNTKVLNLYNQFPFRINGSWYGFHRLKGKI